MRFLKTLFGKKRAKNPNPKGILSAYRYGFLPSFFPKSSFQKALSKKRL
jgi:hypothetical protein